MNNQNPQQNGIFGSTVVWIALFLLVANFAFAQFSARDKIAVTDLSPNQVAESAIAYKVRALQNAAPDVLLLGSSLVMSAAYYSDCLHYKRQTDQFVKDCGAQNVNQFQAYPQASYFENLLAEHTGKPLKVFNLSAAACMASDGNLLLGTALRQQHKPRLVVWGVAPRDFADNVVPPLGRTPSYDLLIDWHALPNVVTTKTKPTDAADFALSALVSFYKQRVDMHALLANVASKISEHPVSLAAAQQEAEKARIAAAQKKGAAVEDDKEMKQVITKRIESVGASGKAKELKSLLSDNKAADAGWDRTLVSQYVDYWHRYNPPNLKRLDEQMSQLRSGMAACKNAGIPLVVVNMPLPRRHAELIPSEVIVAYNERLKTLATTYGATLLDLNQPDAYSRADWIDSLHTNGHGGTKFFNQLAIKMTPLLQNREVAAR